MNTIKIFAIFFLLAFFQLHLLESAVGNIILTLQHRNSKLSFSKLWDPNDFNAIVTFKNLLGLPDQSRQELIFPLQYEHSHITHKYLKKLIRGDVAPHRLEQYLKDYHYFIGDEDITLGKNEYKTVKEKVYRMHDKTFFTNINNNVFCDFARLDLNTFLQQRFEIDFANIDVQDFIDQEKFQFTHQEIIELVDPAIIIQFGQKNFSGLAFSVTVQANRYITINNAALSNLIKLIEWKMYIESDKDLNSNQVTKELLAQRYSDHFWPNHTIFKKICFKNFVFNGLHLDPILGNTESISFENSTVTISENDINTLQELQKINITKPALSPFAVSVPDSYFYEEGRSYEKHSLKIDFNSSQIDNPNKLLDLVDIHNGYFRTILIKNAQISLVALKRIQFLCRKSARVKFFLLSLINLIIIITLFKYNHWILGTLSIIPSFLIQWLRYYKIIQYPEETARDISKQLINTNGGVTFEFD